MPGFSSKDLDSCNVKLEQQNWIQMLPFFFFSPCCSPKPNDLLWNIVEWLVLSHKTNMSLLLFWTDVFLSLQSWLSYTLPSLLIFLIFLTLS